MIALRKACTRGPYLPPVWKPKLLVSVERLSSCQPNGSLFSPEIVQSRQEKLIALLRHTGGASEGYGAVQPHIKGLLVDAAGTLISPSEPAAAVYLRHAAPYGCKLDEDTILQNFRRAFSEPWTRSALRYEGDARAFWRHIVEEATGCGSEEMHDAVYDYFGRKEAWAVTPGAPEALQELQKAGFRLAVVSNFDTRLRPLLEQLQLLQLFDAVIISAEIGAEKPNPIIFETACKALSLSPAETLVIGDDRRNDVSGGRDAGCNVWLYGVDVVNFGEISQRLQHGHIY